MVGSIQRRATEFMCETMNLSYKEQLIYLNLLPINYWLEYLDLIFYSKCKIGLILMNIDQYIQHCNTRTHLEMSGLTLYSQHCKTSLYRDSYFNRLVHLWNALPNTIQTSDKISSFKILLKEIYVQRLRQVFDGDNIRMFKLVCPKC